VCPEIAIINLIDVSLACSNGKAYDFKNIEVLTESFSSSYPCPFGTH
jgi:hypothetical protein